ncbi:hypothetical protein [Prevotella sp. P6B1]|uniref:hypothetical protein n=1 Tax=Prevotella sp. P6B1 TaxID=1410613 RepID=UPI000AF1BB64|nr:hypothetical protein [Prevotella sp. P6B1]
MSVYGQVNLSGMMPESTDSLQKCSIRNFKFQPNKGSIMIDEPNEDDYHFHIK